VAIFEIGRRGRKTDADGPTGDAARASWNSTRTGTAPSVSFAERLTVSFAFAAVLTCGVLAVVLGTVWQSQFSRYARTNMEQLANSTATELANRYERDGGWTPSVLNAIATASSVSSEVGLQVINESGDIIYDDARLNKDRSGRSAESSLPPTAEESLVTSSVIISSGEVVGTVRMWAFGSDSLLTYGDSEFLGRSYMALGVAAIVAVALSCVMGYLIARSLGHPIKRIALTAQRIRNGDLSARTNLQGYDEIGQLGATFDDMAANLEKDIKLEHRLTSDVAHELRTPLMAMLSTVEAMQDEVLPADEEHLAIVADETKRLARLVDAMLQLSRMENGSTRFEPEETDVVWLVRSIVESQEQLFADRELKLRFSDETGHKDCRAEMDADMIRQAVVNIMSNALRYTPEGGWVVVSVCQDRSDVLISVSDTGIGIAREDLNRVFSRFWRSDASRERESGGLGVGLALTKEIIDRHHGYVRVDSELGHGTTFTLYIPHVQPQGRESPEQL
jgi:signal transduction histidine kinase